MLYQIKKNIATVFHHNKMSITENRKAILQTLLNHSFAISNADIEKANQHIDRITIYRTLQTFLKKGIIHTFPSTDNSIRYAICQDHCNGGKHVDNHIHFICTKCHHASCLQSVATPMLRLSKKYTISEVQVVVKGICDVCND